MTATSGGGVALYQGTTNKPIKSAKVNTRRATLPTSASFFAQPSLSTGNNSSTVNAVDGNNNSVTNTYQVGVQGGPSASLTYDSNGNMTSDGTNSYSWDAEDRMIKITYPGTGNYSTFTYDPGNRNVEIVETTAGSVTSTKMFVWSGFSRREVRDSSSSITAQFFGRGETIGGTMYFWLRDRLGSVRELTNSGAGIQAEYTYEPFGRVTKISETVPSDFGFAGYYVHSRSGLSLTAYRAYSPASARFLSRDPLSEAPGVNLFAYVVNEPVKLRDPLGKAPTFVPPGSAPSVQDLPDQMIMPHTFLPVDWNEVFPTGSLPMISPNTPNSCPLLRPSREPPVNIGDVLDHFYIEPFAELLVPFPYYYQPPTPQPLINDEMPANS